ncbi:MAG TPA: PorT family protein [Bacteroidales bacterium]|nr:PorT family protein [Bacteroidales bacterium]
MRNFLPVLFSFFALAGYGQTYVGVKGGYTMSDIAFLPVQSTRMLFADGLDYGLVFKHFNLKYFGFQAELYRVKRGYRKPIDIAELGDTLYKRVNSYVELPIMMQFRLNLKLLTFHFNVGPYIAYLTQVREGDNSSGDYQMSKMSINILRDNRIDYGLIGGLGLGRDFKWGSLYVEGRLGYGYGDMQKHTYPNMPKQSKAVFQSVNVGYLFHFGKMENKN